MNELKIENLSKHYGKKAALNNVSLTLNDGICGLLGPNGAVARVLELSYCKFRSLSAVYKLYFIVCTISRAEKRLLR